MDSIRSRLSRRGTALYLTWLVESRLQAREVERAAEAAVRALRLSRRAGSVRADARVHALWRMLRAHRGVPSWPDFENQWLVR